MTIAVTGATGQLGRRIVAQLLERVPASEVVAVVRDEAKAASLAEQGVHVRVATYTDVPALTAAFAGVEKVVLVSGNEIGQRAVQHGNVIEAAKAAGVAFIAYTSVLHAEGSPLLVAPEHVETEQLLADSGLAYSLLRNGWYHENYAPSIDAARASGAVVTSAGAGRVASASRDDFATAAAVVVTTDSPEKIYELSGDVAWTQAELASAVSEVIGQDVSVLDVDAAKHAEILSGAGLDEGTVHFVVATDGHIAEGHLAAAPGTLAQVIGRPTTPLVDTLRTLA
ncbi:SDR family oxidoreductase [Aeromicrobium sp. Leaf350]|uniref:SDR family oxidoreductase n=1 Tax=Aeromicrobium sp. Leaf350 TaxID=2876565 RepID=UPI001E5A782E|nr:SDR family oxidoreductase [Aeromicrobium sp. Leaf350]